MFEDVVTILSDEEDEDIECVIISSSPSKNCTTRINSHPDDISIISLEDGVEVCGGPKRRSSDLDYSTTSSIAQRQLKRPAIQLIMDACKSQIEEILNDFGAFEMGWGVKVESKQVEDGDATYPVGLSLSVLPTNTGRNAEEFCLFLKNGELDEEFDALFTNSEMLGPYRHFPPIRVRVDYPHVNDNEARIALAASWLLKDHLKKLSEEAQSKLRQNNSLKSTIDFVEQKSVKFLDVVRNQRITYVRPEAVLQNDRQQTDIVFHDPNAIGDMFRKTNNKVDALKSSTIGAAKVFECTICFDRKPAMIAVVFSGCRHVFCPLCVKEEFSLKIQDGQVKELRCLSHPCSSVADFDMIKQMVDIATFRRYCDLTTESYVDQNSAFVRCPRKECSAPMENIPNGPREIVCLACQYHFCATCRALAHPNKPCLTDEQKDEIRRTYKDASAEQKAAMEKQYGKTNIEAAFQDAEAEEWIRKNAKPCPQCRTQIEKISGCNKMMCTAAGCGIYFCWLCLAKLDKTNPYSHFETIGANAGQCAGQLHAGPPGAGQLRPGQILPEFAFRPPAVPALANVLRGPQARRGRGAIARAPARAPARAQARPRAGRRGVGAVAVQIAVASRLAPQFVQNAPVHAQQFFHHVQVPMPAHHMPPGARVVNILHQQGGPRHTFQHVLQQYQQPPAQLPYAPAPNIVYAGGNVAAPQNLDQVYGFLPVQPGHGQFVQYAPVQHPQFVAYPYPNQFDPQQHDGNAVMLGDMIHDQFLAEFL